jgi:hypothetical protein
MELKAKPAKPNSQAPILTPGALFILAYLRMIPMQQERKAA